MATNANDREHKRLKMVPLGVHRDLFGRLLSVPNFLDRWSAFFASMRLSVVLILVTAATSIVGTIIPQNLSVEKYRQLYDVQVFRVLAALGLFDIFHSVWFQSLLVLLTINILVCSFRRLPTVWRIVFPGKRRVKRTDISKLSAKKEISSNRSLKQVERISTEVAGKWGGYEIRYTDLGFEIFTQKGRWTRLGVYAVHLSIVLVLLGGVWGALLGYEGHALIVEGMTADTIKLQGSDDTKKLDFGIKCMDFDIGRYESGAPKSYRSAVTLLSQDKVIKYKDIRVNSPLIYNGIKISQFGYGTVAPNEVDFSFKSKQSGLVYDRKLQVGMSFDIPEGLGRFRVESIVNAYKVNGRNLGEAVVASLFHEGEAPKKIVLPFRYQQFDQMRKDTVSIAATGFTPRYYTVLGVSKDPGTPIVYSGFVLLIAGCWVTFFMSHQKMGLKATAGPQGITILVAGTANKNRYAIEDRINDAVTRLEDN